MASRMTPEVKAVKTMVELIDRGTFDTAAFVVYLSRSPLIIREKMLNILLAFVEYNAKPWHEQRMEPYTEDFHRDCARMHEAMSPYR